MIQASPRPSLTLSRPAWAFLTAGLAGPIQRLVFAPSVVPAVLQSMTVVALLSTHVFAVSLPGCQVLEYRMFPTPAIPPWLQRPLYWPSSRGIAFSFSSPPLLTRLSWRSCLIPVPSHLCASQTTLDMHTVNSAGDRRLPGGVPPVITVEPRFLRIARRHLSGAKLVSQ